MSAVARQTRCLRRRHARRPPVALGRQFVAGVLQHASALCALAAPTVNSPKRLTVGRSLGHHLGAGLPGARPAQPHGAGAHAARSLRVAAARRRLQPLPGGGGLIAAGLDGIDRGLDPALERRPVRLPPGRHPRRGIPLLPQTLADAADAPEGGRGAGRARLRYDGATLAAARCAMRRWPTAPPRRRLRIRARRARLSGAAMHQTLEGVRLPGRCQHRWWAATWACQSCWVAVLPVSPAGLAALRHRRRWPCCTGAA